MPALRRSSPACPRVCRQARVGKEIAEHREHIEAENAAAGEHAGHDRLISIVEAVLLSIVALLAAWSGYSAAKWGTDSSISLAKASSTRTKGQPGRDPRDSDPDA
jgi:hypothetical protein